ncbi:Fe(3+) ABC transporter substrate-binding protein [Ferrovibrio terrae]|uniref:Fe(3+) ABC transporter substrate-binding protein n=1 Tax=Ferrovibrio terrae TaxID=2594003 RepID=A0A516H5X6_9PROT|nr:Fe(3+) ABC transporter substrate-binding protein [Ferrovibrio terrae]QDO99157.1 Fe(3+) ABC transporter substrate-binding protein [Ferrovibrio terrae]
MRRESASSSFSRRLLLLGLAAAGAMFGLPQMAAAQDKVLNLYSSRHYDTDEALYDNFTKATGIKINRIEAGEDQLLQRMRAEGDKSPADVLITVDAGRLWRAQQNGLLQPLKNAYLEKAIPAHLREAEGHWFGFSKRARVFVVNKDKVKPGDLARYEDLADPKWKGRLLIRSSTNVYMQSLAGSMIATLGEQATETWAKAVVANLARAPKGGDTDQLKAVAAGEGDVAVSNTYYLARLINSSKADEKEVASKLAVIFPNQGDRGTHVNISGAGVARYSPNKANAIKFLEYLASPEAQNYFAKGNYEYPVVAGVPLHPVIQAWGSFKEDQISAAVFGRNNEEALKLMDRAGWK